MDSLALSIGLVAGSILVGLLAGWYANTTLGARSLQRAQAASEETIRRARETADLRVKEAELAAREDLRKARARFDQEEQRRQSSLTKRENTQRQTERALADKKSEFEQQEQEFAARRQAVAERGTELEREAERLRRTQAEQDARLEELAGLGRDDARRLVLEAARKESRMEAARILRESREETLKEADQEAQKIMSLAIERTASDVSTQKTTAVITLADDKVKGRIIGQDGKNIKAFEAATGLQLIVDDTPNQVTLSGFHPIKREVARLTLEKLVEDGTIHPRRIEETVRKMRRRTDNTMRQAAEDALRELRIRKVHPEIVKLLGRLRFRTSYGQNVLDHSKEVGWLTGLMAAELGLDETLARRAGLLHDIGKAIDYEREGTHPEIGEEVAKRYGEHEIVANAIASHHEDCPVISPISTLVAAADALSGARPGARRKTLADFIRRVEKLEGIASAMEGVLQAYAIQAGRELRVIARHDRVTDEESALLATDIAQRIQAEVDYPGKIKVTVIREMWATATAR